MNEAPLHPQRIFAALEDHEVQYVLVGGIAVQAHGHVRMNRSADRARALIGNERGTLVPAPGPRRVDCYLNAG